MSIPTDTSTTPFLESGRLLRQLHRLFVQGKPNSGEADAVREEMDGPWYAMTEQERERVGGLSEDLYALAEGGPPSVAMCASELDSWKQELLKNKQRYLQGDIDAWLAFWRKPRPNDFPSPTGIPLPAIRIIQAQCWETLGDPETAALFRQDAENLVMEQLTRVA